MGIESGGGPSPLERVKKLQEPEVAAKIEAAAAPKESDEHERKRWGQNLKEALNGIRIAEMTITLAEKVKEALPDSDLSKYLNSLTADMATESLRLEELRAEGAPDASQAAAYMEDRVLGRIKTLFNMDRVIENAQYNVNQSEEYAATRKNEPGFNWGNDHRNSDQLDAATQQAKERVVFLQGVKKDIEALGGTKALNELIPEELKVKKPQTQE